MLFGSNGQYPNAVATVRSTSGGWGRPVGGTRLLSWALLADFLERGTKYRLLIKIVAFETSTPSRSHWSPESGDYRVLAEQILEASWTKGSICPDSVSLPAEASER